MEKRFRVMVFVSILLFPTICIQANLEKDNNQLNFGNESESVVFSPKSSQTTSGLQLTLSSLGLEYAKDVLVGKVLEEIVPLNIPDISSTTVTYLGTVHVSMSNISLSDARVSYAAIDLENGNVTIFAQGVFANISFNWKYDYGGWMGDSGLADVEVSGMQAGVVFNLTACNGTLEMSILEHAVVLDSISIKLHNYYSWLYNWLVTSFHNHLQSAIQSAINQGLVRASLKLNNYLQSFPRLVPVDTTSAIDATISQNPTVLPALLSLSPKGEFVGVGGAAEGGEALEPPRLPQAAECGEEPKMVAITVTDQMLNSASQVYFQAGILAYPVEELPDSSPLKLNTGSWRFILPGLYRMYPHQDMVLYFRTTSAPEVTLGSQGLGVKLDAEMEIQVVMPALSAEGPGSRLAVASVGMGMELSGWANIRENNLTSSVQLQSLDLSLKWSNVGNIPVHTLQAVTSTMMKGVIVPLANRKLMTGFPLPVIPSISISNATVEYREKFMTVCTDIEYTGGYFLLRDKLDSVTETKFENVDL